MPMSKTGYDISSSNKKSQLALSYLLQDVGPSNADASHGSARLKPSTAVIARRTLAYALGFAVLSEASGHGSLPLVVNSLVSGVGAAYAQSGYHQTTPARHTLFHYYPRLLDTLLPLHAAYNMFDLVSTLRRRQNALQIVPIIVHHVLGTAGALAMTRYRRASFFPCVFLVTELTQLVSVIVAFRSSHEARLVRVCAFLLLRTFTAPLCLTYAWSRLKRDVRARLDKTRDASVDVVHVSARTISDHALITLQSELRALPLAVSIGTAVNVSVIGALNLWWTVLLARSIVRNGSDAAIAAAVAIRE